MSNAVAFSGGKDSTALLLWAKANLPDFVPIFCDTKWEHPLTYAYIAKVNAEVCDGKLITISSEKFAGMAGLVTLKMRVPSPKARFCTENLKVIPMQKWIAQQSEDVTLYQGIRADESDSRRNMPDCEWSEVYDCEVRRPLLRWTAEQVFAFLASHGVEPNPLYLLGARRVGCFPCVLITHGELKRLTDTLPEVWDRISELERYAQGRSFFPPNFIPRRYNTGHDPKSGKSYCKVEDVRKYLLQMDQKRLDLAPTQSCLSVYNLCE